MGTDVLEMLNHLIESVRDAEQSFRTAVPAFGDPAMRRTLLTYAEERATFVRELQAQVRRLGGTPPRRGTVAGALERALFNVQEAVSGRRGEAALAQVRRADAAASTVCREALQHAGLPADVRSVLERQARRVEEAHESLMKVGRAA